MNFERVLTPSIKFDFASSKQKPHHYDGYVYIFSENDFKKYKSTISKLVEQESLPYQEAKILEQPQKSVYFVGVRGPVWILFTSQYGSARDFSGSIAQHIRQQKIGHLYVEFSQGSTEVLQGFVVGLEMAMYHYFQSYKNDKTNEVKIYLASLNEKFKKVVSESLIEARSIQLARHLVNLPPNIMNPQGIENLVKQKLNFSKSTQIEIWNADRCAKERMGLLCAVGQGAEVPPRLIHLKYRPKQKTKNKPMAFVGKGITFDTGGLDIKPSSAMRLMKKDMGGAAAVVALAYWVDQSGYQQPCDFYLALAENSVDGNAMRPSDVYQSRAGFYVEIDNTDAEGRLVLADAMNVAITAKEKPEYLIDVATLTGAIKVALGADVAGLFSNDEKLSSQLHQAGEQVSEPNWRMPLVKKYWSSLNSNFADFKNSGEGFGGAITAALFLEKFAGDVKWAHLDVYCWSDRADGAIAAAGGSGQPVQTLIQFLKNRS